MKKRTYILLFCLLFIVGLFLGGVVNDSSTPTSGDVEDADTAFYIEDKSNIFVVTAKALESGSYYVVNLVFDGIKSIFGSIFGI